MTADPYKKQLFEMRLMDIYHKYSWLSYELSIQEFIKLFPVEFKRGKPLVPDRPVGVDLDRDVFLEVLVAFRQSFS